MEHKEKKRKATPEEKKMFVAGKREVKGKTSRGSAESKALTTVSSGSTGGRGSVAAQGTTSSAPSVQKVQQGREAKREAFLTETKKGARLQKMETKAISKGKTTYSKPQFQVSSDDSAHTFKNGDHKKLKGKFGSGMA